MSGLPSSMPPYTPNRPANETVILASPRFPLSIPHATPERVGTGERNANSPPGNRRYLLWSVVTVLIAASTSVGVTAQGVPGVAGKPRIDRSPCRVVAAETLREVLAGNARR